MDSNTTEVSVFSRDNESASRLPFETLVKRVSLTCQNVWRATVLGYAIAIRNNTAIISA